ncbi:MAG: diadenylate cyclase CdaA, partial [Planctomycetota bacterium]|nr:diadenylate cyclase CdaA [Planctomycetota bacterium]
MPSSFGEITRAVVEILFLTTIIYLVMRFLRGTRGVGIFRGFAVVLVVTFVALLWVTRQFELARIQFMLEQLILPTIIVSLIIIFQPELRRALLRLGYAPVFRAITKERHTVFSEIAKAARNLSSARVGALIAIEREVGLAGFMDDALVIDSVVSSDLIEAIFQRTAGTHDGAVVIRADRLCAARCILPLSETVSSSPSVGTRHKAALGISEETDAVAVIVSEESGKMSLAIKGKLEELSGPDELERRLNE